MEKPKNIICTTHAYELRMVGECWRDGGCRAEGNKREKRNGTTEIA